MQNSILTIAIAFAVIFAGSTSFAQSVEVTKKKMKTTEVEKSSTKKACCEGMAEGESCDDKKMSKNIKVIKEKNESGAMVTKVTIKTINDGVEEVKTLEGAEAEKYVEEMEKDDDMNHGLDHDMKKHHETDKDVKIIKKKVIKETEAEGTKEAETKK